MSGATNTYKVFNAATETSRAIAACSVDLTSTTSDNAAVHSWVAGTKGESALGS